MQEDYSNSSTLALLANMKQWKYEKEDTQIATLPEGCNHDILYLCPKFLLKTYT